MKHSKHGLQCLLLVLFLILTLCTSTLAADTVASGTCGKKVNWALDRNGVLTISGKGKMEDYLIEDRDSPYYGWFYTVPWSRYSEQITEIVVTSGVTSIGSRAFPACTSLVSVTLADSVEHIGSQAFINCTLLEQLNLPVALQTLGKDVFSGCGALSNLWVEGADLGCTVTKSSNIHSNDYPVKAETVRSHLYVDGQDLIRVECVGGQLIVERYNQNLQLLASRRITSDLSAIWGGFFAGETDNYVVCGWSNPAETDDTEVLRIFQYDKDWNLKDQVSLYGANTQLPFRAASLRMAEFGGMLYIHTGHQMYRSHDGKNHQANMTLAIRQEGLDITDAQYLVSASYGYVSHSFNQFILIDEDGSIITLDHGDAYPRSAVLQKYVKPAGGDTFSGSYNTTIELDILELPGGIGANSTGASLGGLAKTSLGYLTAYNYNGIGEGYDTAPRDVFLSFTSKNNFSLSGTKTLRLTDYISDGDCSAGTPVLVSTGADEGYVLWEIKGQSSGGTVAYARYTADGSVSEIHTMKGALSDCQPILYNGKIIWYVTDDSAPKFYTLDTGSIPEESPITEINQMHIDGNEVLASVTWCQQTPGLAYCVFYDQGGQMLSVMSQTLETGENQITFPCPQNAVQVMIFAVNSNHVPQCAYATQKIN